MNDNQLSTIVTSTMSDLLVIAWLDAKFHKSTSKKTRKAYDDTMQRFRNQLARVGLDLYSDPGQVLLVAQAFAAQRSPSKKNAWRAENQVALSTYNHRLSIISSCYVYAKKQPPGSDLHIDYNPIDALDRAKIQEYAAAQPLNDTFVVEALASINQTELIGKRDYTILSILLYTGRRAQELTSLTWGDVQMEKGSAILTFQKTKGNEIMIDKLPVKVTDTLLRWLHAYYGADLSTLTNESPLWVSLAKDESNGKQIGYLSINAICKKHLGTSKVHTTRHTFAHSMEAIGAPVSEIQARLGHKSLATTGRYLASLKRAENRHGEQLAALYGIE